jgi:phosphoribosylaminoimidazole-succinocarboxamide synthase
MGIVESAVPLLETRISGLPVWRRGKVRDVYDLGDRLLIVATDRLSAFDVVLPTGIPDKGRVLTQLSLFWFSLLGDVVPNHVLTADVSRYPPELRDCAPQLEGRSMIVRKTRPLPVECVVRGYITGSGWKDYEASGAVFGIPLPVGLRESDRITPAIFTPSTKAEVGHDENIAFAEVERLVGKDRAGELRRVSLAIYERARSHAEERGIILADTKFEFGLQDGGLVWIDEALTPDSSRFWPKDSYEPGRGSRASTSNTSGTTRGPVLGQAARGPPFRLRSGADAREIPRGVLAHHREDVGVTGPGGAARRRSSFAPWEAVEKTPERAP